MEMKHSVSSGLVT